MTWGITRARRRPQAGAVGERGGGHKQARNPNLFVPAAALVHQTARRAVAP